MSQTSMPQTAIPQTRSKPSKRYRGYVLTHQGVDKLRCQLMKLEAKTCIRQNARTIAERVQLTDIQGIHPMTVRRILQQHQGVDKASIERVFRALELLLDMGDYAHASLYTKSPKAVCQG
ncbi:MAG: hypothetical protein AAF152_04935 [Cyanobacteria bacterium P01_A01_bin.114]